MSCSAVLTHEGGLFRTARRGHIVLSRRFRFDRWQDADLATRISLVSTVLAAIPLLLALGVSVAMIQSLLWEKIESDLTLASYSIVLGVENRIEQVVSKVEATSRHPVLSNALVDAGDIERYVDESLRELCETTNDILAVELVDFQGTTLSQSCQHKWRQADTHNILAESAINGGKITLKVVHGAGHATLLIAAPIRYRPTGSMEGALISEIDLTSIFAIATASSAQHRAWQLSPVRGEQDDYRILKDTDRRLVLARRVSPVRDNPLDLVVELSVDKRQAYAPIYWLLAGFFALGISSIYIIVRQSRKLAQWVVGPLRSLEATAEFVTAGAFDRLPSESAMPQGKDSLSKLTRSIHRMIASLRETQVQLSQRLGERTAQVERIEADRRLKELALASSDSGILILRQDEPLGIKRIHYANDAFFTLTGLIPEEVIDSTWPDALLEHCRGFDAGDHAARANATLPPLLIFTRKDGTRIFLSLSTSRIIGADDGHPLHRIVIVSDVSERTRAEFAHRARLESLREVVFETDLDGRATFLNQAWQRITGYLVPNSIGQHLIEFLLPADVAPHLASLREVRHSGLESYAFEARVRTEQGELRWLRIDAGALMNELGEMVGFSGTMADVTLQHEASLALALRDRALQAASNGIVIASLETPDYPIIYVNPAFERITGYSFAEAIGRNCRFLHATDRQQPEITLLRKAIAERQPCQVTLRNYRKNGKMFWNQLAISPVTNPTNGQVTHYVGVQTDITEGKKSEDMLVEWLSRLDAIFTLSPDPIVCFDSSGRLSYANAAAERIFQTSLGALKNMSIKAFYKQVRGQASAASKVDALIPHDSEQHTFHEEAAANAEALIELAKPVRRVLQQTYRYCGSASTSLVLYFRDVTRETELDRMKSEFLSTAAHELRTPMASIMGFSELLMIRKYDEARTHDLLATINRQAQRLTTLLSDLLDLARIEARRAEGLHFEWIPLCAILEDTLGAFLTPENRQPAIRQWTDQGLEIRADRGKFQQALINLLSNAYKFSPDGGDVSVRLVGPHPTNPLLVGIEVSDRGIGLSSEEQERVFERFYRSDRSGHIPGTGLGLSLVREIMTVHGGNVTLESAPGEGTRVTLWFPTRHHLPAPADACEKP